MIQNASQSIIGNLHNRGRNLMRGVAASQAALVGMGGVLGAVGLSVVTGLFGFGARPASAQNIDISNVAGIGSNINHSSLIATGGSIRPQAAGGAPISGGGGQFGFFNVDTGTDFTLLANQKYTISFTSYLVGVERSTGNRFDLNNSNVGYINFSFTSKDSNGKVGSSLPLEESFLSSELAINKLPNFYLTANDAFTNTPTEFKRYEFKTDFTPTQTITAKGVGFNISMASSNFNVYGATAFDAEGQLLQRAGLDAPLTQTELNDGVPFGVSIQRQFIECS